MLRSYSDITSRLGDPIWYDENGVPRYDEFTPKQLGVYDDVAVYYKIECQDCRKEFLVASCESTIDRMKNYWMYKSIIKGRRSSEPNLGVEIEDFVKALHYGDPPIHHDEEGHMCVGCTMNCIDIEVIQVWVRNLMNMNWERRPELEGEIKEEDAETIR